MRDGCFVVDAHTHLFPRSTTLHGRRVHFTPDQLLDTMARHDVDMSVVIARPTDRLSLDQLRALHDDLAEVGERHPDTFRLFCWGVPRFGEAGVNEVRRCWRELGFVGLKLHPTHEDFRLDEPASVTLIRAAAEDGQPVMVHTQSTFRGAEPWRVLFAAKDFPDTQFLMAHVGGDGSQLQSLSVAKLVSEVDNIILEVSTTVTDPMATYVEPARILGPERIVYGSNAPIHPMSPNLLKIDLLDMEDAWRELMLGGNMRRLLNIELS